jgi:hypothetical protein
MRTAVLLGVVSLGAPGLAHADRISFGVGLGPGAAIDGALDRHFDTDGEIGGRFFAGVRRGDFALEATFFGTDLHRPGAAPDASHSTLSLGADLKRYLQVVPHVELYARGGIDYTWLVPCPGKPRAAPLGYAGPGLHLGAGVELGWDLALSQQSRGPIDRLGFKLWGDAWVQESRLSAPDLKPLDARLTAIDFGFSFDIEY